MWQTFYWTHTHPRNNYTHLHHTPRNYTLTPPITAIKPSPASQLVYLTRKVDFPFIREPASDFSASASPVDSPALVNPFVKGKPGEDIIKRAVYNGPCVTLRNLPHLLVGGWVRWCSKFGTVTVLLCFKGAGPFFTVTAWWFSEDWGMYGSDGLMFVFGGVCTEAVRVMQNGKNMYGNLWLVQISL